MLQGLNRHMLLEKCYWPYYKRPNYILISNKKQASKNAEYSLLFQRRKRAANGSYISREKLFSVINATRTLFFKADKRPQSPKLRIERWRTERLSKCLAE